MTTKRSGSSRRYLGLLLCAALVGASALFCARPCSAQISFGKMREAAGKTAPAPKAEDDDPIADVKADPKSDGKAADEKSASSATTGATRSKATVNRRSNSRGAANTQARNQTAVDAAATNGIAKAQANAAKKQEEEQVDAEQDAQNEPETKPNQASAPKQTNAAPTKPNAPKASESKPDAASASTPSDGKRGPILGKPTSHKYRAGMLFGAHADGPCTNVIGTAPVPMEFPEQKVRTLEENFPKVARVDYRDVKEGGARQLVFKMHELKGGQTVEATALYEVTRYPMLPPADPKLYEIPKKVPREVQRYLKASQYMESTTKTIKSLAKETTEDKEGAWDKVAAILAYVRDNIQYKEVMIEKPMRGAMAALKTGDGDCEDMSALFIAMCRAIDVPARLVRVPGHCWAEFYLVDDQKEGYWFPAQVAGTEELGSLQDTRVILQKGDSFHLPESPREESLYVKELFMGNVKENGSDPVHQFVQEMDPKD